MDDGKIDGLSGRFEAAWPNRQADVMGIRKKSKTRVIALKLVDPVNAGRSLAINILYPVPLMPILAFDQNQLGPLAFFTDPLAQSVSITALVPDDADP